MKIGWLVLLLCVWTAQARADIYKYVSASGEVIYTDHPIRGAKRMNILVRDTQATVHHSRSGKSVVEPQGLRVDAVTQGKRDGLRRSVLHDERAHELQLLQEAQAARAADTMPHAGERADSPAFLQRQQKLANAVKLHTANLAALDKELSRLKN